MRRIVRKALDKARNSGSFLKSLLTGRLRSEKRSMESPQEDEAPNATPSGSQQSKTPRVSTARRVRGRKKPPGDLVPKPA